MRAPVRPRRRPRCEAPARRRRRAGPGRPGPASSGSRDPGGGLHLVPRKPRRRRRSGQRPSSRGRRPLQARGLRGRAGSLRPRLRPRAPPRDPLQPRALGAQRRPPRRGHRALARVHHPHRRAPGQARVGADQVVAPRGSPDRAARRVRSGGRASPRRRRGAGARAPGARRAECSPVVDRHRGGRARRERAPGDRLGNAARDRDQRRGRRAALSAGAGCARPASGDRAAGERGRARLGRGEALAPRALRRRNSRRGGPRRGGRRRGVRCGGAKPRQRCAGHAQRDRRRVPLDQSRVRRRQRQAPPCARS